MYKSSAQTFFFKYLFPLIFIVGVIPVFIVFLKSDQPELAGFAKGFVFMYLWSVILVMQMPFRLRRIEATETGIRILDKGKHNEISYRQVVLIIKYDLLTPFGITIKYRDASSGLEKKITYLPADKQQKMIKEDVLTSYIREQIKKNNPDYSKDAEPSLLKNFLLNTLISLPFLLVFIYFAFGEHLGI